MKKIFLIIILFVNMSMAYSNYITKIEYWFDDNYNDKVTSLLDLPSINYKFDTTLQFSQLGYGLHIFNFRCQDSIGNWSNVLSKFIYVPLIDETNKITKYEYWFDDNYSVRKSQVIEAAKYLSFSPEINLSDFGDGLHIFNFRVKDENGNWSNTFSKIYFNNLINETNKITQYEYWFDDNYSGKKSQIIEANRSLSFSPEINLSDFSDGLHIFNFRVKDENGNWSSTISKIFLKPLIKNKANLTEYEYWFDNNYNSKITRTIDETAIYQADITEFFPDLPLGKHHYNIRFKESNGAWTAITSKPFEVTFDYIVFGSKAAFSVRNYNDYEFLWDFGDGSFDSIPCPTHDYEKGAVYIVKLKFKRENQSWDSVTRNVGITGIKQIFPDFGGNAGSVTQYVYGHGFNDSTSIYLKKEGDSGEEVIKPDTIIIIDENNIILRLDLVDYEPGNWDYIVEKFGKDTSVIIPKGFEVQPGGKAEPWFRIIGSSSGIRRGDFQNYKLLFGNSGNIDAKLPEFYFKVIGDNNVDIKFDFEIVEPPKLNDPEGLDYNEIPTVLQPKDDNGNDLPGKLIPFTTSSLPPQSSYTRNVEIRTNDVNDIDIYANSPGLIKNDMETLTECLKSLFEVAGMFLPSNCIMDVFKTICDYLDKKGDIFGNEATFISATKEWFKLGAGCIADFTLGKVKAIAKTVQKVIDYVDRGIKVEESFKACRDLVDNHIFNRLKQQVIYSKDPNDITGPKSTLDENYIKKNITFPYVIRYENDTSAMAPAQKVVILNQLDKSKFDLSTFQLGEFTVGGRVYSINPGLQEYFNEIKLNESDSLLVRIEIKLDTLLGVIKWEMTAIDSTTKMQTEDPFAGFLPPNILPPEGEGSVSYTIKPLNNLTNGTEIYNQASIIFDWNEPIITNKWLNTIDNDLPSSSINPLDSLQDSTSFIVRWKGSDTTSGVEYYNIFYNKNGGDFYLWKLMTTDTAAVFHGNPDAEYCFFSQAVDYAGNVENKYGICDTKTKMAVPYQDIYLNSGWSMISSFIKPEFPDSMNNICKNVTDNLVVAKNQQGDVYIPEYEINNIGSWNIFDGYKVYFSKTDTLRIFGKIINPQETPVPLKSSWNMISYIRNNPLPIIEALESITDNENLLIAKDNSGKVYIPSFGIDQIGNMNPGEAFMLYMITDDSLLYPPNQSGKNIQSSLFPTHKYIKTDFENTGNNSHVIINFKSNNFDGNEIAVFNKYDKIVGAGVISGETAVVTIWGDDELSPVIDGATKNETLIFMIYDIKRRCFDEFQLYDIVDMLSNNKKSEIDYQPESFYFARTNIEMTSELNLDIRPNPNFGIVDIEFSTPSQRNTQLKLYSVDGKLLLDLSAKLKNSITNSFRYNFSNLTFGEYNLIMDYGPSKVIKKMIITK